MADKRPRPPTNNQQMQTDTPEPATRNLVNEFHSYPSIGAEFTSLSDSETFSPDAKKGKAETSLTLYELQENIMKQIRVCHEDLARRIGENNAAINTNKIAIEDLKKNSEFLFQELQDVKTKTTKMEASSSEHERKITNLEAKLNDMERHQRRVNLRLHGLPETEGENVKRLVTDICRAVYPPGFPAEGELSPFIDVCHRVGPRRETNRPRPVIIRFATREARDNIWRSSRTAKELLSARRLRFTEDLTAQDKAARNELWPQIDEAKKAGKRAFFVGARAFVDGKEIKSK